MNKMKGTYKLIFAAALCLIFTLMTVEVKADTKTRNADEIRTEALRADKNGNIYKAIELYSQYLLLAKDDVGTRYRLATLCFETRNYPRAVALFDSVTRVAPSKYPVAFYNKGLACMNLEKYNEATDAFTKFKKYYKSRKDRPGYRRMLPTYTANADWAGKNNSSDDRITVFHQGTELNHPDIDFAPLRIDDRTMFYCSLWDEATGVTGPVRQIFTAELTAGKWQKTGRLGEGINDPEYNTGNPALSSDGQSIYFTRTRQNWQNRAISEIWVSHLKDGEWQPAEKLPAPVNREDCTSTQPATGKNLRTGNEILYFVSDRQGGKGGLDIWFTEFDKKTNTFRKEINLSARVNSPGDECTPYYDVSSQSLYFSSKGRKNGFGGYDIYKTTGSGTKWTEAAPLPRPVNSSYDDYYYSVMPDNREGFFTSNRPGTMTLGNGTCCDDIYSFRVNECAGYYSFGKVKNEVDYEFYRKINEKYKLGLQYPENNSPVAGANIELYLVNGSDEILISKAVTDNSGTYNFLLDNDKSYKAVVRNYGYMEKEVTSSTKGKKCADSIDFGTTFIKYLPAVTIRINVYYDYDKYKLSEEAKKTIDEMILPLFDFFPKGIVETGSHTDGRGTEAYNLALSQKRSESIVNYLISRGISSDRVIAKGYGMSMPIAPNTKADGSDNPEGRQLNRRTEFRIVGEVAGAGDNDTK